MTITKRDLVDAVYDKAGISKKESSKLAEYVFEVLKQSLVDGDRVKISGFGNFEVREKRERMGRNPQTGEAIKIAPRRVVIFKASAILKTAMNSDYDPAFDDEATFTDDEDE